MKCRSAEGLNPKGEKFAGGTWWRRVEAEDRERADRERGKDWRGKMGKSWEGKLKMQTKKYELKGEARQGLGIADDSSGLSKVGMSFGKQALDR